MTNIKRIIVIGMSVLFIMLALYIIERPVEISEPNKADGFPSLTPIPTVEEIIREIPQVQGLAKCQMPDKDMYYGGIGGSENNFPKGISIDQDLTKRYNMPVATGDCGTYWYIAGWWFNESEMMRLPSESIMYKMSPYASNGSGGGSAGYDSQMPIAPVPEKSTTILVTLGIFMLVALKSQGKLKQQKGLNVRRR